MWNISSLSISSLGYSVVKKQNAASAYLKKTAFLALHSGIAVAIKLLKHDTS